MGFDAMTSLLRQIVAGPRIRHAESNLDLCYVTDDIIATSGPSSTYPKRAYRNPTDALVRFLDSKHGENWSIWEFRAEGTGYPDEEVYGRIHHFPWPDHHPPPFAIIPPMMASMRNWMNGKSEGKRVIVVHCKAGKGRSGTAACSFLISEQGWSPEDAMKQFTERRMRVGFGAGVSIPSQLRYLRYIDRWANKYNKKYVERPVELLEIHIWGVRDGVKVQVESYVDEGRKIKCFHRFYRSEWMTVDSGEEYQDEKTQSETTLTTPGDLPVPPDPSKAAKTSLAESSHIEPPKVKESLKTIDDNASIASKAVSPEEGFSSVIIRPRKRLIIPTSDVNIDFERRATAAYTGWTMITSVAHVWFNAYFEGGDEHDSGVFEEEWDALDGIKGTYSKGARCFDKFKVLWRYPAPTPGEEEAEDGGAVIPGGPPLAGKVISEPAPGEPVQEGHAADWRGTSVFENKEKEPGEQGWSSDEDEDSPLPNDNSMPTARVQREQGQSSRDPTTSISRGLPHVRRRSSSTVGISPLNTPGNIGPANASGWENDIGEHPKDRRNRTGSA
ncbi:Telomerase protein component 1 [Ophidiomyces ophidiicola]|uniref:Telomerase protein component 1 n=1 Tax=Ophidiomyces ophidiicola TaxID=1387563 RepID=A0ACB8URE2_9EURO|nr:Telomerase protein component 1 [Ophidiomyces ophidiicola]KAI1912006.1 Telomerase protein component 1 [Ophidiomyces ophidiicola]KAI1925555.1 Telomerase protein component 1 [Ophidiomyces ophidiicola]KAI1926916.1 Telomerase protein component 1 [Ophidiomyces ophidiicola]KAI1945352.1 Telomerase protein component 1 [Ophidiomyces ophidiicola]KAI1948400.1 Telomerase protein component 1 [Ophidiomyces ophidiicola]